MAVDLTTFLGSLRDGTPEQRLAIANDLKKAGFYTGKVSSKFNSQLVTAVTKAEADIAVIKPFFTDVDRITYYKEKASEAEAGGGSGEGKVTRQRYVSTEQTVSKTLDDIAQDLLGRKLTDKEKAKYAKRLIKEQNKPTSDTVTTYTGSGMATTTGGLDEGQFLIEQISQTDEAKANRALKGYDIMLNMLGGLR